MRDVGTGGFEGFGGWQTSEVAYFHGDHGAALQIGNVPSLVRFALGGDFKRPAALLSDRRTRAPFARSREQCPTSPFCSLSYFPHGGSAGHFTDTAAYR